MDSSMVSRLIDIVEQMVVFLLPDGPVGRPNDNVYTLKDFEIDEQEQNLSLNFDDKFIIRLFFPVDFYSNDETIAFFCHRDIRVLIDGVIYKSYTGGWLTIIYGNDIPLERELEISDIHLKGDNKFMYK